MKPLESSVCDATIWSNTYGHQICSQSHQLCSLRTFIVHVSLMTIMICLQYRPQITYFYNLSLTLLQYDPVFLPNIRLGQKILQVTNALAYYKRFKLRVPDMSPRVNFDPRIFFVGTQKIGATTHSITTFTIMTFSITTLQHDGHICDIQRHPALMAYLKYPATQHSAL